MLPRKYAVRDTISLSDCILVWSETLHSVSLHSDDVVLACLFGGQTRASARAVRASPRVPGRWSGFPSHLCAVSRRSPWLQLLLPASSTCTRLVPRSPSRGRRRLTHGAWSQAFSFCFWNGMEPKVCRPPQQQPTTWARTRKSTGASCFFSTAQNIQTDELIILN